MSCELDIVDLADEWTVPGTITAIPNLSQAETVGVLSALAKTADQAPDVITDKGIGKYGLQLRDLQLTGIVKRCFRSADDTITILSDASVFTGKDGVTDIDKLLGDVALQQRLMIETITSNMNSLTTEGIISGNEDSADTAAIAGAAGQYTPEEIKGNFLKDALDKFQGFTDPIMDALGKLAAVGALVAVLKNSDILDKIKGIGQAVVSLPTFAADTVDTAATDLNVDKLIGSTKIPSIADATKSAGAAASSAASGFLDNITATGTSLLDSASKAVDNLTDII